MINNQMAKELWDEFGWKDISCLEDWQSIATFVNQKIIEGKIEELEECYFSDNDMIDELISDLTKQLEQGEE